MIVPICREPGTIKIDYVNDFVHVGATIKMKRLLFMISAMISWAVPATAMPFAKPNDVAVLESTVLVKGGTMAGSTSFDFVPIPRSSSELLGRSERER